MKYFKYVVTLIALIAIVTGLGNLVLGVRFLWLTGVQTGLDDPILNGHIRFLGAIWFGYGVFLLYCLADLPGRYRLLNAAFGLLLLAGMGRVFSVWQFGAPTMLNSMGFIAVAVTVNLLVIPLLLLWLARLSVAMRNRSP